MDTHNIYILIYAHILFYVLLSFFHHIIIILYCIAFGIVLYSNALHCTLPQDSMMGSFSVLSLVFQLFSDDLNYHAFGEGEQWQLDQDCFQRNVF